MISLVAQELILAGIQAARMYSEYAERAAEGAMSDEELLAAWGELEKDKVEFRTALAKKKAKLMAQASKDLQGNIV